jgi:hypothetical protein
LCATLQAAQSSQPAEEVALDVEGTVTQIADERDRRLADCDARLARARFERSRPRVHSERLGPVASYAARSAPSFACGSRRAPKLAASRGRVGGGGGAVWTCPEQPSGQDRRSGTRLGPRFG